MANAFQSDAFQNDAFQVVADVVVTPTTLALILTSYAPVILTPGIVTPPALALTLTTYEPTIIFTGHKVVTPSTLALALTLYAPTIILPGLITPPTLPLILTTYAPIILLTRMPGALKYILELHDSDGDLVSILQNAYGISFSEATNEPALLDFSIPADDNKVAGLTRANEVWLRNYNTGVVMKKFRLILRRDLRR